MNNCFLLFKKILFEDFSFFSNVDLEYSSLMTQYSHGGSPVSCQVSSSCWISFCSCQMQAKLLPPAQHTSPLTCPAFYEHIHNRGLQIFVANSLIQGCHVIIVP